MNLFETLHTYCGHIEDVHVGFGGARINRKLMVLGVPILKLFVVFSNNLATLLNLFLL